MGKLYLFILQASHLIPGTGQYGETLFTAWAAGARRQHHRRHRQGHKSSQSHKKKLHRVGQKSGAKTHDHNSVKS